MKKIFKDAHDIVSEMIKVDVGRNTLFQQQEAMFNGKWNFPAELSGIDWMRKVVSTDPHDHIRSATRVLSSPDPAFKFMPYAENPASKQKANEYERILKYLFLKASQRTQGNLISDIVFSSLMYDMVAAYVDFIPKGNLTGRRKNLAMKYGPFSIIVKNPKDVHFRYSDAGLEQVACVGKMRVKDIVNYWGDKAKIVADKYSKPEDQNKELIHVDYWDMDKRLIWCEELDGQAVEYTIDEVNVLPEFWPWVIRAGGTKLTSDSEDQYLPLNASISKTDQWEHDNIVQSLIVSEAIARAAKARERVFGVTNVETDYMEPGGIEKVSNPDPSSVQDIVPPPLDQSLVEIHALFQNAISKTGVSRVLQGGDLTANTSFAMYNQAVQVALNTIRPYKELSEKAMGDIAEVMCRWVAQSPEAIEVYGMTKDDMGHRYIMVPEEINTDILCVTVELKPDVPTDRMERINAASVARQQLGYSQESGLEDIGVTDPQKEIRRNIFERLLENEVQNEIARSQAQVQLEVEQAKMQMQAELQQQQMAAQQEMQAQQQPPMQGQGFNPAMGGTPPAMGAPSMTRETLSNVTQGGAEVANAGTA